MFIYDVVHALRKHSVDFAVAGGYAVALHGAVRGTLDVDIVLALNEENFRRAEAALTELGLRCRLPLSAKNAFQDRRQLIDEKNLIAWTFVNRDRPSELVDVLLTDDLAAMKVKTVRSGGVEIPVVDVEDLIQMKIRSNRKQDREDVQALKDLQS